MSKTYDLVAIGGGTGGLVTAAGAGRLGLRAALVEKAALGGDCLWTGCVPSKALIASGRAVHRARDAASTGVPPTEPEPDFATVMARLREARDAVARHDDPQRFRAMGVDVHFGRARFLDPRTVEVDGVGRIRSKRFVIATGARPWIPPVPGLEETGYWTSETLFDQDVLPNHVVVLGGGPVGVEMAQALGRLGAAVTLLESLDRILATEDPDVSALLERTLTREGVRVRTGARVVHAVRLPGGRVRAELQDGEPVDGDVIFVAAGRRPDTAGLELGAAGVETDEGAVRVDRHLRTTARKVWAVGDVTGGLQFTHVAEHMARGVLLNALSPVQRVVRYDDVPRVTYTDPEIAHIGLSRAEAEAVGGTTYAYDLADLDRAIVDGATEGFVRVTADRRGRILGATIVARGGGELLFPLVLARTHGLDLGKVAGTVFPYPTMVEGVKRVSNEYMKGRLDGWSGRALKRLVRWLA